MANGNVTLKLNLEDFPAFGKRALGGVDVPRVEFLTRELLLALGEDPDEDRIKDTPRRVAKWWKEFLNSDPGSLETSFSSIRADQLVLVQGMKIWSLCEHHLLPFWAEVAIAYIPREKVLGLSKFARIAHHFGHKLQIQERFVEEIALKVQELTSSPDVAVLAQGEHLCMTMRGVKTPALMTSSALHGAFKDDPATRAEFMALARKA